VSRVGRGDDGRYNLHMLIRFSILRRDRILRFAAEPTGLQALIRPTQPLDLVLDGLNLVLLLSSSKFFSRFSPVALGLTETMVCLDPDSFRHLLGLTADENARDPTRPPLIESLCVYLRSPHPQANGITVSTSPSSHLPSPKDHPDPSFFLLAT
jgi:hypothetical protein